jgi:hypothetical protein
MGNFVSEHQEPSQSMDILAAVFFVVAGVWLVLAMSYSCMIVVFLRMRARGQLDAIYDEDFGRIFLPPWTNNNGNYRLYIPTGCIFRRYMHHLQQEQRRQSSSSSSSSPSPSSRTDAEVAAAARYMTTEERRRAMEVLLWKERDTHKAVHSCVAPVAVLEAHVAVPEAHVAVPEAHVAVPVPVPVPESSEPTGTSTDADTDTGNAADQADSDLEEGPVCLICLDEFNEPDATVLQSPTCSHLYHKDCILDWLQRQGTRECPGCRVAMITEDEVWEAVQRLRKKRRTQLRLETAWCFMFRRESEIEETVNYGNNGTADNSENTDDDNDDAMMVSPTLSSDTASSEEEELDANV